MTLKSRIKDAASIIAKAKGGKPKDAVKLLTSHLEDLGVSTVEDLDHIEAADLEGLGLRRIPTRKLYAALTVKQTPVSAEVAGVQASATIVVNNGESAKSKLLRELGDESQIRAMFQGKPWQCPDEDEDGSHLEAAVRYIREHGQVPNVCPKCGQEFTTEVKEHSWRDGTTVLTGQGKRLTNPVTTFNEGKYSLRDRVYAFLCVKVLGMSVRDVRNMLRAGIMDELEFQEKKDLEAIYNERFIRRPEGAPLHGLPNINSLAMQGTNYRATSSSGISVVTPPKANIQAGGNVVQNVAAGGDIVFGSKITVGNNNTGSVGNNYGGSASQRHGRILDTLASRLTPGQLDAVILKSGCHASILPGGSSAQVTKAVAFMEWFQGRYPSSWENQLVQCLPAEYR